MAVWLIVYRGHDMSWLLVHKQTIVWLSFLSRVCLWKYCMRYFFTFLLLMLHFVHYFVFFFYHFSILFTLWFYCKSLQNPPPECASFMAYYIWCEKKTHKSQHDCNRHHIQKLMSGFVWLNKNISKFFQYLFLLSLKSLRSHFFLQWQTKHLQMCD